MKEKPQGAETQDCQGSGEETGAAGISEWYEETGQAGTGEPTGSSHFLGDKELLG